MTKFSQRVDRLAGGPFSVDVGRASVSSAASGSAVALVGGGSDPRRAKFRRITALFLDELPEWDRRVLEVLREPLESGVIHISRCATKHGRPSSSSSRNESVSMRLARACEISCLPDRIARYRAKSRTLLDRIDLGVKYRACVEAIALAAIAGEAPQGERLTSAQVRDEATAARNRQLVRQGKPNARLAPREIEANCRPDAPGAALLAHAMARLSLSARAYHRILKVARTIADLAGADAIAAAHVAEAVAYRRFDRL